MLKMLQVRAEFHVFCCSCYACNYIFFLSRDHLMTSLVVFQHRRAYCEYCIPFFASPLPAVYFYVCCC